MRFYLSLFVDYFKNYMKTRLTYRSDFWVEILSDLLFQGVNLFFILVVFQHTNLLGGWTGAEVLFIFGFFMVPYGIFGCFFNLWGFSERYIVKGEMDRILTRPAYNLLQLVLENMDPASLAGSLVGLIVMGAAWPQTDIALAWYDPFVFALLVLGAVLIYAGVYVALIAVSFFIDAPTGILPLVWNLQNYGRNPINVYNKLIKLLLTWILPFAFVGFYPAAYFLDPAGWTGMALLTPVVGVVFFAIGMTVWRHGVLRYRGAGS
ncbi:ABC transporter permease [Paenibacillus cymbidii]|uniref:ABC transporter permease n=1 Tax=Paenibacillus cymbidii TaxID=1639034 RepID=UPI001080EF77|nr:ABC-2 family transporter protein [Paenibacillus cymbidii]